jgi:proteasome lid subunit RPN8/RPN11
MLGYVGEWHTHPGGGPDLSPVDWAAALNLKSALDRVPIPTNVTVVTMRGVHPHIFEPAEDGLTLCDGRYRIVGHKWTWKS